MTEEFMKRLTQEGPIKVHRSDIPPGVLEKLNLPKPQEPKPETQEPPKPEK